MYIMTERVVFKPIGTVLSVFKEPQDTKQGKTDKKAKIILKKEYEKGLNGLDEFSHIIVVFNFHRSKDFELFVKPLKYNPQNKTVGVFATHSPFRPNAIGVSVVKLLSINKNILLFENRDILDSSPVLDIKPYLPERIEKVKLGWYVAKDSGGNL